MAESEPQQPITDEQIQELLRCPELQAGAARDFAFAHVYAFEDECRKVLLWQRTEGGTLVLDGEGPEAVRQQTEGRIAEARTRLHEKLLTLLAWARDGGRR